MAKLSLDLKVAFRTVVRARFVSALAVVAFALGIGVTTADVFDRQGFIGTVAQTLLVQRRR